MSKLGCTTEPVFWHDHPGHGTLRTNGYMESRYVGSIDYKNHVVVVATIHDIRDGNSPAQWLAPSVEEAKAWVEAVLLMLRKDDMP